MMDKSRAVADKSQILYGVAELAGAAGKLFGASQDVAAAAFRLAGKKELLIEEAEKIVNAFAKKEVK